MTFWLVAQCMVYTGHLLLTTDKSEDAIGWAGLAEDFRHAYRMLKKFIKSLLENLRVVVR